VSEPLPPTRAAIIEALNAVADPRSGQGLVRAGLVHGLAFGPGRAGFMMEVRAEDAELYAPVREAAEAALRRVPGVDKAQVVLTASRGAAAGSPYDQAVQPRHAHPSREEQGAGEPPPAAGTVRVRRGAQLSGEAQAQMRPPPPAPAGMKPPHVRHIVAVASGKGGVGKSTVAVNLACALALLGQRVGLLDADVYGPSAPQMTGVDAEPTIGPDKKLLPLRAWGIQLMSIGLLVDASAPMIWRGPMASSALNQMLNDVAWGSEAEPIDVLIVDMPPGTGDIQLTLAQRVSLSGAVVVSTPQDVALLDVRRGVSMFEKTHVPILGVVENMSYFPDPATGEKIPIFGHGGARATAHALGAPFLGEVPIEVALRVSGDTGRPYVVEQPQSASGKAFLAIAEQVAATLAGSALKEAPRIVFED
jgi:ATP-binding protein involved in chromosome partitioning